MMVYFNDGKRAPFDRDKTSFRSGESYFTLSKTFQGVENYADVLDDGRALINWDSVAFVRMIQEEDPE